MATEKKKDCVNHNKFYWKTSKLNSKQLNRYLKAKQKQVTEDRKACSFFFILFLLSFFGEYLIFKVVHIQFMYFDEFGRIYIPMVPSSQSKE